MIKLLSTFPLIAYISLSSIAFANGGTGIISNTVKPTPGTIVLPAMHCPQTFERNYSINNAGKGMELAITSTLQGTLQSTTLLNYGRGAMTAVMCTYAYLDPITNRTISFTRSYDGTSLNLAFSPKIGDWTPVKTSSHPEEACKNSSATPCTLTVSTHKNDQAITANRAHIQSVAN